MVGEHELRPDELELLAEACRMLDLLEGLRAVVAEEGPLRDGRAHPATVEQRLTREQLRKTLAQLAIPGPAGGR